MSRSPAAVLLPGSRPAGLGDTGPVTAGAQQRESTVRRSSPPLAAAELEHLREGVSAALTGFLDRQRGILAAMDATLVPVVDEVCALAAGGKRLRPAFAYWGWRGARSSAPEAAEEEAAVLRAVAALEFVHASALVHDDVMDGARTRRGRPATHIGFAAWHAGHALDGDGDLFGTGAAILVGDLALVWSDELLRCSGISVAALIRARAVWDTMRTEVTAGQYLDLLRAAGGLPGPDGAPATPCSGPCSWARPSPAPGRTSSRRTPPSGCRWARRSSCATTSSACSATPRSPGSPPTTTSARASRPC
jgi:geranylgeranyl diphosphate synthase type I